MHARLLSVACATLLLPAALVAGASASAGGGAPRALPAITPAVAFAATMAAGNQSDWREDSDPRCGRGRAWGCRRDRGDDRWDDRRDDRYDRRADRWERERYERARWEQARWERARYRARYGYSDRRYERYDGYAVACLRAGGRVLGAVLVVCVP